MRFSLFLGVLCVFRLPFSGEAQQWIDVSQNYGFEATTQASWLGCGMSLADFNLDGLDDLTFANSDGNVVAYAQLPSGAFELAHFISGTEQAQGVVWFDADGDDDLDLFLTRRFAPMELHMRSGDVLVDQAAERGLPEDSLLQGRGICLADYDLDGDLDAYVCMYHDGLGSLEQNFLFKNDGMGFFEDITEIAGVGNGLKQSFQGAWFDYDRDGDEDLWVVNDRDCFPNALYENLGGDTFIDVGPTVGAAQSINGMTATVGDCDNDGDMELFCTDIENNPNLVLNWDGSAYEEVGSEIGLDGGRYSWGGCFVDADGDMWSDLMVATYRFPLSIPYDNYFYMNTQEGNAFVDTTSWGLPHAHIGLYCLGVCDIDHDLAPDVVGFGNMPFVQILRNGTADLESPPNRLAVHLCGTETNRWAIGAEIEIHAGGVVQEQFVSSGSDFMTQQAFTRYFGLGNSTMVDSVVVRWRGGNREVWYDLASNSEVFLIEGSSTAQIDIEGTTCIGDTAWATSPFDAPVIRWNGNVVDSPTIALIESGTYVLECEWLGGLFTWTDSIEWEVAVPHVLTVDWIEPLCHGDQGTLNWVAQEGLVVEFEGLSWDGYASGVLHQGGQVSFETFDPGTGCTASHLMNLSQPAELGVVFNYSPPLCHSDLGQVEGVGFGGTPGYVFDWGGVDPNALTGGQVDFTMTDVNGCVLDSTLEVVIPDPVVVEVEVVQEDEGNDGSLTLNISGGSPPYSVLWSTGAEGDTALYGLAQGAYSWVVEDANGCLLLGLQEIVNLDVLSNGEGVLPWSLQADEGGWRLVGTPSEGDCLELYSLSGKRILFRTLPSGVPFEFDGSSLPAHGVLRVLGADGTLRFSRVY